LNPSGCIILGAGGHCSVLIEAMAEAALPPARGILDANSQLWGQSLLGIPVRGGDDLLPELAKSTIDRFVVGVGSVGNTSRRQVMYEKARQLGLDALVVIHPRSWIARSAEIGPGSQILAGALVNTRCRIGANVIVNTGAIVEHDCVIEDHVHISTGACIAGDVRVGRGAHIGIGSSVRQGITIGSNAVIGAGAAVVSNIGADVVALGVPARESGRNE